MSFPTRERGLKSAYGLKKIDSAKVVPHAGTWIEIKILFAIIRNSWSFPTRERGLKSVCRISKRAYRLVVPHAGTWIEIQKSCQLVVPI